MTRPSAELQALARMCDTLAQLWPDTQLRLRANLHAVDGWPHRGSDHVNVQHTAELTTVEQAANQRLHLHLQEADMKAGIRLLAVTVHDLITECRRILADTPLPGVVLCSSVGREGNELARDDGGWSDPTCRRPADKLGLCSACYQRERKWRALNGLRAREVA